jgi:hypothetical protein
VFRVFGSTRADGAMTGALRRSSESLTTIRQRQSQPTDNQDHIRNIENPCANWPNAEVQEVGNESVVKHTVNRVSDATRKDKNKGNEVGQGHVPLGNENTDGSH